MISFAPFRRLLEERNITTYYLRNKCGIYNIDSKTIKRLMNDQSVSTNTINAICQIFDCPLNSVIAIKPDSPYITNSRRRNEMTKIEQEKRQENFQNACKKKMKDLTPEEKQTMTEIWQEYAEARKAFESDFDIFSQEAMDFQQKLTRLIKAKNTTAAKIAEEVGIQEKTLSGYRHGKKCPSMPVLIGICMALELDIKQSMELLASLGFCFLGCRREHYAYVYLITEHRGASIAECNEILAGLNIEPRYFLKPRNKK